MSAKQTVNVQGGDGAAVVGAVAAVTGPLAMVVVGAAAVVAVVAIVAMLLAVALIVGVIGLVALAVIVHRRNQDAQQAALTNYRMNTPPTYLLNGRPVWTDEPPARALLRLEAER